MKNHNTRQVPRRPNRPLLVMLYVLVTVVAAISIAIYSIAPRADLLTLLTNNVDINSSPVKSASKATADITEEVESEGIILLDNKNKALPLEGTTAVNVFGSTAGNNFSYGGTGSGSSNEANNVTFYQGLENAGLNPNPELKNFYDQNAVAAKKIANVGTDWNLYELPQSKYDQKLIDNAREYSDTAVVVLTRKGGEGFDLPLDMGEYSGSEAGRSYLELTPNEEDLLDMVEKNFGTVVVVLNSPNAMELGFLDDVAIDAALWVGVPGATGTNAIGKVLTGKVNPSGKTVDTFPYQVESAPSYYNFGAYDYSNVTYTNNAQFAGTGDALSGEDSYHYVEYAEGIYVGYRYYETAAADGYIDYDAVVQYPFGYGLSYTTFEERLDSVKEDGTTITATVTVKNTGKVAGKQVAEIYVGAPYTPGGIEKSSVVLAGFAKTKELAPGESQTLTITFDWADIASYDYTGVKADGGAYVLDKGDYAINLQTDSHTVVDSRKLTLDHNIIYNDENAGARPSDDTIATNQFDDVSFGDDLTYVSRADWEGTMPTERAASSKKATDEQIKELTDPQPLDNSETTDIVTGAHNGLTLADLKDADYNDPKWDKLLDQATIPEMKLLVGNAGWITIGVDSVGKPSTLDSDGPNGLNNILSHVNGTQLTGQSVLGYTWNTELAERVGALLAKEAKAYGVDGLYAPGSNLHRSPFGGRNYEYVSEDPLLTGRIVAAEVRAIRASGVYSYTKHFALNDQETHRGDGGLATWANEQSMRELYLRPFELTVKEGGATGMMSSYNRLGTTPTAESRALLTTVLRDEWGFRGAVVTDCTMAADTSDVNRSLRAGNDLNLNFLQDTHMTSDTADTAAGHQALRRATHNVLYMIANSSAIDKKTTNWPRTITTITAIVDVVVAAGFALYLWRRHKAMVRWRQAGKPKGPLFAKLTGGRNRTADEASGITTS